MGLLGNIFPTAEEGDAVPHSKQARVPAVAERQAWRFTALFFFQQQQLAS